MKIFHPRTQVPFLNVSDPVSGAGHVQIYGADEDRLILGDATHEGGDVVTYRDAAGNRQLFVDADAAANALALSVYGGVVAQNYLTVGQAALNTSYPLYVNGEIRNTGADIASGGNMWTNGIYVSTNGMLNRADNQSTLPININVVGADATDHAIKLQIDANDIIVAQATGDGAGGIVGKRMIVSGGQCHARTAVGAADYNPSAITSDYIIAVDNTAAARAVIISTEDEDSGTAANPRVFIIKDESGGAGANNITITLESGGTIDGAANVVINANYGTVTLYVDGTNAWTI